MSSALDFLVDKLFSFSAKVKEESSKFSGPSYVMSVNSNSLSQQFSPIDLLSGLIGDAIMNSETPNQVIPLKQPLGYLSGNYSFSFLKAEKLFSHSLCNLAMDISRHSHSSTESRFLSNDLLVSNLVNIYCTQFSEIDQSYKSNFELNKPSVPSVSRTNMSVSETLPLPKKICEVINKHSQPNYLTLNKELANRKAKEMLKRSKKRRRRQKKNQQSDGSASVSDDDVDSNVTSSLTSVCIVSDDAKFGCTMALSHSLQMTPNILSSFVVSVNDVSDDDSEWESYEPERFNTSCQVNKETNSNILVSNLRKSKSSDLKCLQPVDCANPKATSFISSFIVSVENSSDDESDWDSCETVILDEMPEFEFLGLHVTNLCNSQANSLDYNCSISNSSEDDETVKSRIHLLEVNKIWNESTEGLEIKPRLPSKVSFAPEEELAEVFPVDMYERKGEWEIYATERLRFKRKIDELEKILSPCLHPDHRSKMFKKIYDPIL